MTTCIIFNPSSGSAEQAAAVREALGGHSGQLVLHEPASGDEARELAAQALQRDFDQVVAAGGDGTVNAVINGLAADFGKARLGIIPLGTGNDLCRTLAVPLDPLQAVEVLLQGRERAIDLVRVEGGGRALHCANVASGGFAAQTQEAVGKEAKATWGPLAYLFSAVGVLPDLTGYHTSIRLDDGPADEVTAFNVIVANGRTAGGGYRVAGQANPEDGLLDVIVVRHAPLLDLAGVAAQLLAGDYLDSEQVVYRRARRAQVRAAPPMSFSIDGDPFDADPVTFTVVPRALRVVVGPDYAADPAGGAGSTSTGTGTSS